LVGDFPEKFTVEDVRSKLSCETSLMPEAADTARGRSDHDPKTPETVPQRRAADLPPLSSEARFVLQNNVSFRASANSHKRISCEVSLKK
jgi:hypothetical protein